MAIKERLVLFPWLIHLMLITWVHASSASTKNNNNNNVTSVDIGVVLDWNSRVGSMYEVCMSMAVSDFYSGHPYYKTRLFLHTRNAHNQHHLTSQVLELLQKEEVHGIVGSQTLREGSFIEEVARRVQVPVISFTSRSKSVSDPPNQYIIRTTPDNSNQLNALAAICKGFNWTEVTVLYEATESGIELFSELIDAFQVSDIRFSSMISISPLANDYAIKQDLKRLKKMENRVFLVHMNAALGGRLFLLAKTMGMMEKNYAWIVTDSIGNFLSSMDYAVIEAMEGVIGIRAFVPISENLKSFNERWREKMIHSKLETSLRELNVYGLLAYDTLWALAMATEMVGPMKSSFSRAENGGNGGYISSLSTSNFGPKLVHQLFDISFVGLTGDFKLTDGKPKPSSLEIFNVIGIGGKTIGYWTPNGGISGKPLLNSEELNSTSTKELKPILWPGDSGSIPKGSSFPPSGKLKVGIPKKTGFTEFMKVTSEDHLTGEAKATGFCIDLFHATLNVLPFELDFSFMDFVDNTGTATGTYTDVILNISSKYDIVVADTTILADRATSVDFSLPYSESGIVFVVKNKQNRSMWIFFKPFRLDLWLTILGTCICIGIVLRILENPAIPIADNAIPCHKERNSFLFWFPISVLAFPERNTVNTNWSRFVLVVWLYMAFIVMQSYTAKLSSMFTVDQLNFKLSQDIYIGYQINSFARDYLINHLHINGSKLRPFTDIDDIHNNLSNGGKNGGYDAIFEEIPYVKLFLNKYGSDYKMVGPTYMTDGFGFAFPSGSKLTTYFSNAILKVRENITLMSVMELKNFGPKYPSNNQTDSINNGNPSLTVYDFGGLFIIFGSAMLFAIFCSWTIATQNGKDLKTNSFVHPDLDLDSTVNDLDSSGEQVVEIEDRQIVCCIISNVSGQINVDESNSSESIEQIPQARPNHSASRYMNSWGRNTLSATCVVEK